MKISYFFRNKYAIFAISVIIHISVVLAVGYYRNPEVKLWENGIIAKNLLHGKGFSMPPNRQLRRSDVAIGKNWLDDKRSLSPIMQSQPTSNQAPGYPVLLFLTWKLFGEKPAAYLMISLIQAMLISSMVFPVGWLARRWFGEKAQVLASWIVCLMPLYIWYATRLHQPAIVMTFHPWLLAGWLSFGKANSWRRTVVLGLATGLAGLFQPVLLGVFGFIGLILLLKSWVRRKNVTVRKLLVAASLTLLVVTPWTVRNYMVHDQIILIKNCFGKEFWIGNNPSATGTAFLEGGDKSVYETIPPKFLEFSEMKLMKALQREAIDYVRNEPISFVTRTLKKIFWYWTAVPKNKLDIFEQAARLKFYWLQISYWFIFLLLACFARIHEGRISGEYAMVLILYFLVYSITYGLTHVGHSRFRGEIEYIVIPAVAQGVSLLWDKGNHFLQQRLGTNV
jgi:4-amino-4-deoxy-L-arabinose transferase-like glycosyltransferase